MLMVTGAATPSLQHRIGTYWNQTYETTACLACPEGETSLQGATRCYTPCVAGEALDTSTLECVPIPSSLQNIIAGSNTGVNLTTADVYIVAQSGKLEDTIGATAQSNETVVIALGPNVYPQQGTYVITTNMVLVNGVATGNRRRHRFLQSYVNNSVILAPPNNRHFTMANATLIADGVTFVGDVTGASSGGVVLSGPSAKGEFFNSLFTRCRAGAGNSGGGLLLAGGASATVQNNSLFELNSAAQGGAVYAGPGSNLTLGSGVRMANNSAPRTSPTSGGGAGLYLAGATLVLGSNVTFSGNDADDITTATATVTCANPALATGVANCTGCTGSYAVPATCPLCSPASPSTSCTSCPQGSYGGSEAELSCQLCPYGYTTWFPPSSTSSANCVPITDSPTNVPTRQPTTQPTQPPNQATSAPTTQGQFTPAPTSAPVVAPTPAGNNVIVTFNETSGQGGAVDFTTVTVSGITVSAVLSPRPSAGCWVRARRTRNSSGGGHGFNVFDAPPPHPTR